MAKIINKRAMHKRFDKKFSNIMWKVNIDLLSKGTIVATMPEAKQFKEFVEQELEMQLEKILSELNAIPLKPHKDMLASFQAVLKDLNEK